MCPQSQETDHLLSYVHQLTGYSCLLSFLWYDWLPTCPHDSQFILLRRGGNRLPCLSRAGFFTPGHLTACSPAGRLGPGSCPHPVGLDWGGVSCIWSQQGNVGTKEALVTVNFKLFSKEGLKNKERVEKQNGKAAQPFGETRWLLAFSTWHTDSFSKARLLLFRSIKEIVWLRTVEMRWNLRGLHRISAFVGHDLPTSVAFTLQLVYVMMSCSVPFVPRTGQETTVWCVNYTWKCRWAFWLAP